VGRGDQHGYYRHGSGYQLCLVTGVNHVIFNFKYGARDAAEVLEEIGQEILPQLETSSPSAAP